MIARFKRIFVIVLDSLGIGEMPDAAAFDDVGADTLGHIADNFPDFKIPNLESFGLGNLKKHPNIKPAANPLAKYCVLKESSNGKDTMTGHWEMMGIRTEEPFLTFTETGFPKELIDELEKTWGRKIIGNKSASGTAILEELAMEEINDGKVIVYTSADSVLQICGNEETMGLDTLYRFCESAREITMKPEWRVGRVIARPYVGKKPGEFRRTSNRHDYAVAPPCESVLDAMKKNRLDVISIGKINDIFSGHGITKAYHSNSSVHGMQQTIDVSAQDFRGLVFTNLVDFDALWGHRRDVQGYGREIESFDELLGELIETLGYEDLLILTADHGNDPTFKGTDHTREKVPFLAYSPAISGGELPEQDTFAVIGMTIADNFGLARPKGLIGTSMLNIL